MRRALAAVLLIAMSQLAMAGPASAAPVDLQSRYCGKHGDNRGPGGAWLNTETAYAGETISLTVTGSYLDNWQLTSSTRWLQDVHRANPMDRDGRNVFPFRIPHDSSGAHAMTVTAETYTVAPDGSRSWVGTCDAIRLTVLPGERPAGEQAPALDLDDPWIDHRVFPGGYEPLHLENTSLAPGESTTLWVPGTYFGGWRFNTNADWIDGLSEGTFDRTGMRSFKVTVPLDTSLGEHELDIETGSTVVSQRPNSVFVSGRFGETLKIAVVEPVEVADGSEDDTPIEEATDSGQVVPVPSESPTTATEVERSEDRTVAESIHREPNRPAIEKDEDRIEQTGSRVVGPRSDSTVPVTSDGTRTVVSLVGEGDDPAEPVPEDSEANGVAPSAVKEAAAQVAADPMVTPVSEPSEGDDGYGLLAVLISLAGACWVVRRVKSTA